MKIHPTALIDPHAKLGRNVEIGAYSVIGPHVVLADGCRIHHHVTIEGHTSLGEGCEVYPQAVLGTRPQDLKYGGERTELVIGKGNVFREMVTVHPGTANGGGITLIGDRNFFLIGVHVAHDCHIGKHCVIANYVQFAGHVHVEDFVNMGGHSAVHHFVTIGKHAFVGGMTRVPADVPPFMVLVAARGTRSEVRMVNGVGLQRSGYGHEDISALKSAFMQLYSRRARMNGTAIRDRVQAILDSPPVNPHVEYLCQFLLRSFAHGRNGRYLEALRADAAHRSTWKPQNTFDLTVEVIGKGQVQKTRAADADRADEVYHLTALAAPGWDFVGWDGPISGHHNPASIMVNRDQKVTATFAQIR